MYVVSLDDAYECYLFLRDLIGEFKWYAEKFIRNFINVYQTI